MFIHRERTCLAGGNCPSWTGGVARSAGVVVQLNLSPHADTNVRAVIEQPPRLRLCRSHPSYPGGAIAVRQVCNRRSLVVEAVGGAGTENQLDVAFGFGEADIG